MQGVVIERETLEKMASWIEGLPVPTRGAAAWGRRLRRVRAESALRATLESAPPTDVEIEQWAERNDIRRDIGELRTMVGDARTLGGTA